MPAAFETSMDRIARGLSIVASGPREIVTPFRPIPLDVPAGLTPNEFFNSAENLRDLVQNNGLLRNREDLLLYRKALGHST
jgi:capsular polysaccharide biosynthesis protein